MDMRKSCLRAVWVILAVFVLPLGIHFHGQQQVDVMPLQALHGLLRGDFHQLVSPVQVLGQLGQVLAVEMAHVYGIGYGRIGVQVADADGYRGSLMS